MAGRYVSYSSYVKLTVFNVVVFTACGTYQLSTPPGALHDLGIAVTAACAAFSLTLTVSRLWAQW